ncbi:LytR C-terminal domain-containing protein [Massilia sp. CF038]|uniref:tetratricopeptide repeat protein n=1 Tax=Massilia sp. CF038 TaxID=1881045 RepID=UPI00090F7F02|nr:LytR C-terminal domain-containing protein [Massilia sp. CF038]SHH40688.1 Tetratricopeptide repeat-containing protein [Massilia sp. CF038]
MKPSLKRIVILCSGALLLACADMGYRMPQSDPVPSAEHAYRTGRVHHLAHQFEQARADYEAVLRAVPGHVNARNGLAVLAAEAGDLDAAIALWEGLTANAAGVDSGYLLSNLGYAYYLRGDLSSAQTALESACLQDPLNDRAWHHLGNVLGKLGQRERAQAMYRQAAALRGHDFKSDYAIAAVAGVPAIEKAVKVDSNEDTRWARTEIRQDQSGMFVLERIEAAPRETLTLEISNGNGVKGMARAVARSIGADQGRVVRLTNQKGFGVRQTRVEYQASFRLAAERLATRVGGVPMLMPGASGRADIRVVLGHDRVAANKAALVAVEKSQPGAG